MPDATPVGLIGLGLLGGALASRLLGSGFSVAGFDIDARKVDALAAAGGIGASSVAEVANQSRVVVLAVFDTDQVEHVVEGEILPALDGQTDRFVICASTCDPDRIATLAERAGSRGLRFLEVPVSGTSEQVRRGQGVGLIGGDRETAEHVASVIDAMFPRSFHIGRAGDGGRAKLAINLILGLNRVALAEGLVFASRLGLDPARFLDVARGSAAYCAGDGHEGPQDGRG